MGIPFGQKIFIGNFFRLKFTPIIGTENLLIEEIQPIPYIHIPVLKSEHPIHQSLIFRMPAFLPTGQISLPTPMIIAGISPIDKKSAFVVKSQIYTLIVKSLIFKKIILFPHRFLLYPGSHSPGILFRIPIPLFSDDIDYPCQSIGTVNHRHRSLDNLYPFDTIHI